MAPAAPPFLLPLLLFACCYMPVIVLEFSLHMSNVNVEVKRHQNENALSLVRRFQKRVQESGVLPRVRSIRYNERDLSPLKVKRAKMRKLESKAKYDLAKRLGKIIEKKKRR